MPNPNLSQLDERLPVAPLKLIILESAASLGARINDNLVDVRHAELLSTLDDPAFKDYLLDDYRLKFTVTRFASGEGKVTMDESVRGRDVYILTDVMNHSITYDMRGFTNYMSPDDHYTDLRRVIAAINGKARRITVIMPFLYEGRQHKRSERESLDCAVMIRELTDMG
ncbi:MAG: ribose-phosphate pyrophosphokinase-like domain-containing protein, partial [Butyrivibrio sp.]|nr:ribose-phosphate pyrophosphokinase-like domain-containing protein [Butyrivibrio sp.]